MPDKRIYHFQTPRTTPTNGLKSDFFWWFMRFVRVPPNMKVGQIGPTFLFPEKTVNFFGVKPVVPPSTLKMRKSHKKLARVYAYTRIYANMLWWGQIQGPTSTLYSNRTRIFLSYSNPTRKFLKNDRVASSVYYLHFMIFMMLLTFIITMAMIRIIMAVMIITKYSLPTVDFATRYSTRYSDFLLQPYSNPTRSKKRLLVGAWSKLNRSAAPDI